ncbi:MAG: peptide ABC transporter substrate-binding protein, partial [Candidatus Aenigmarchaeota archaeon]|nr:peptide ABC transporter substrate-binding protein [Candidatus Aenigmarchaeota archaeon]
GTTEQLFEDPLHPYTKALLAVIPIPDPTVKREEIILKGTVPSPENPPPGCRFHTRCPIVTNICKEEEPELREVGGGRL